MTVTASRFVRQGKANARTLTRAWILLKLADGWDEGKIAETFAVTWTTVKNVTHRFTEGGLDLVLHDKVQQRRRQALTGKPPAHLIAITCSPTPDGHDHWTVRRLSNKAKELGFVSSISSNTIHQLLKKTAEWQTWLEMSEKCPWCHPKMSVPQAKFAIQPFFKGGKLGVGMLLQRGKRGIVIHGGAWLANNEQDTDDSSRFWCDPTTRCYGAAR